MDLFIRLAEIGKLANLPDVLVEYRQHLSSISYTKTIQQYEAGKQVLKDARLRRGINVNSEIASAPTKVETKAEVHRKWAWWALSAGNRATARKHALLAIVNEPFEFENLKVLACAIRGH